MLVPVDVQALVVPTAGSEATVAVGGIPGDPEPFDAGAQPLPGVHLHWAMPDALLRGGTDATTGELAMPELPDRWVVIRHLYPIGSRSVHITGWVVDALTATVVSLLDYRGQAFSADPAMTFLPFDGMRGGPRCGRRRTPPRAAASRCTTRSPTCPVSPQPLPADGTATAPPTRSPAGGRARARIRLPVRSAPTDCRRR